MADGFVHTVFKFNRWTNEVEGDEGNIDTFETKEAAVEAGRERAIDRKTEHVIHNQDGVIAERNSYGNDPAGRPG